MDNRRDTLIYLAGIVDGEGCISIGTHGFTEMLAIQMGTREAVELFATFFGTSLVVKAPTGTRKQFFAINLYSKRAVAAIKELRPYLRVKARQADIVIALRDAKDKFGSTSGRKYSEQEEMIYARFWAAIRHLNAGGPGKSKSIN